MISQRLDMDMFRTVRRNGKVEITYAPPNLVTSCKNAGMALISIKEGNETSTIWFLSGARRQLRVYLSHIDPEKRAEQEYRGLLWIKAIESTQTETYLAYEDPDKSLILVSQKRAVRHKIYSTYANHNRQMARMKWVSECKIALESIEEDLLQLHKGRAHATRMALRNAILKRMNETKET